MLQDLHVAIAAAEPRLLSRLRELVETESPSEDRDAVNRANDLFASWLPSLSAKTKRHKSPTCGDVLEINLATNSRKPRVLLLGHLDTVWPLGTLANMPWKQMPLKGVNGKLFGPGILDMKAGVLMALTALEALQALDMQRPVTLLLNSDEEVGSPFSRPITERLASKSAAVFVLEPAQGLAYKTARKGVGHFELRVQGIAAHAGVDFHAGHSAILEMARQIERISSFTDPARGLTVNVGTVTGGTRSNVIAATCSAEIDVRITKSAHAEAIVRRLRSLRPFDKACKLTLTGGINRPPMERSPGTVALFRKARTLAAQLGITLEEAATGGGSDGNFTAALGIPTLDGMGAIGAGAHADHEHIVTKHLVERTTLLAALIASV